MQRCPFFRIHKGFWHEKTTKFTISSQKYPLDAQKSAKKQEQNRRKDIKKLPESKIRAACKNQNDLLLITEQQIQILLSIGISFLDSFLEVRFGTLEVAHASISRSQNVAYALLIL